MTIEGQFDSDINEEYDFDLTFSYPSSTIKCTMPKIKKNITTSIKCYSKNDFTGDSQVLIEKMIVKKKYKEILFINSFKKETYISCGNYEIINSKNLEKKNAANYTFLQMNNYIFNKNPDQPSFNLFINSKYKIPIGTSMIISAFMNVKENMFFLRNLEEHLLETECKPDKEYDAGNAKFICEPKIPNSTIDFSKTLGLNIDTTDICGIPRNADPVQTDNNIRKGIEPDYNNERVFNTKIPIIIAQSINGTMCHDNGKFEIYGKTEDNIIENINNVNVFLSIPPISSFCSVSSKNKDIKFSCSVTDKFSLQKISIEKQMIQNNGTVLFILSSISSTDEFSCSIDSYYKIKTPIIEGIPSESIGESDENDIPESSDNRNIKNNPSETIDESGEDDNPKITDNINIGNKIFNSKSSSGISGGALAAIIIVCSIAVLAIIILTIICLKKKTLTHGNNNSTVNAVIS